jgi:hypothetical protein
MVLVDCIPLELELPGAGQSWCVFFTPVLRPIHETFSFVVTKDTIELPSLPPNCIELLRSQKYGLDFATLTPGNHTQAWNLALSYYYLPGWTMAEVSISTFLP